MQTGIEINYHRFEDGDLSKGVDQVMRIIEAPCDERTKRIAFEFLMECLKPGEVNISGPMTVSHCDSGVTIKNLNPTFGAKRD